MSGLLPCKPVFYTFQSADSKISAFFYPFFGISTLSLHSKKNCLFSPGGMSQSFGENTMSLRASASAVRGNPLNSEGIASSRGLGTCNDNQSQLSEGLPPGKDFY